MKTTGNTIYIPGGTSGIGLGLALRFQDAGNTVIVGGRRRALLERIAAEHPGIDTVEVDVTDPASLDAAFEAVTGRHPELNVLIAMAGIMVAEDLHGGGFLATAERTITTNLLGPIRMLARFIPFLATRTDPTVITVSSGLAFVPLAATPSYSATKAAIHSFTQALRVQLADTPIQVLELVPPAVQTELTPGQQDSPTAMPLEEFLDETMSILREQPNADEILVERVGFLRFAEANGTHAQVLGMLASAGR